MEKEQIIENFIRTAKRALDAGAMYFHDHPMFLENVDILKASCEGLLTFVNPITIGVTPSSLFIGDAHLENAKHYADLAHAFHLKKIKSLEIREGVSIDDLKILLINIALPLKDIIQKGGFKNILPDNNVTTITIEDLDYSQLLYGDGEECKDVWSYILFEAVEKNDVEAIDKYADTFDAFIDKSNMQELLVNDKTREHIDRFLDFLKTTKKDKYRHCAKSLLKSAIKNKKNLTDVNIKELSAPLGNLEITDLADTLLEEIVTDDSFDAYSFNLFSELTTSNKQNDIATTLSMRMKHNKSLLNTPKVRKKMRELFSEANQSIIPQAYRHFLTSVMKQMKTDGAAQLDRTHIEENFRFILLDLLSYEEDPRRFSTIIDFIIHDWNTIIANADVDNLMRIMRALAERLEGPLAENEALKDISHRLTKHIEESILQGNITAIDLDYFIPLIDKSTFDVHTYFDQIFNQGQINSFILSIIFKLFPESIGDFITRLKERERDTTFLLKVIDAIRTLDNVVTIDILKNIYSFSGQLQKQKALQAMQSLTECDSDFIFGLIAKGNMIIRKEALLVAVHHEHMRARAAHVLLSAKTFFGWNQWLLKENIQLIEGANLTEAQSLLEAISKKRFFWNKTNRQLAQRILDKWHG